MNKNLKKYKTGHWAKNDVYRLRANDDSAKNDVDGLRANDDSPLQNENNDVRANNDSPLRIIAIKRSMNAKQYE